MQVLKEIPIDEVAEIQEMEKKCLELHAIGPSYATLEMEVVDTETGLVTASYADLSRSWTRNFYNMMAMLGSACAPNINGGSTYADASLMPKDVGGNVSGSSSQPGLSWYYAPCEAGVGRAWRGAAGDTQGIYVGRSATAESIDDYALITPCAEGTGTNQMQYQVMAVPTGTWIGGSRKWSYVGVRQIVNNSSATIGVNEVGIQGKFYMYDAYQGNALVLIVRDALVAQLDVLVSNQLTVTYTMYGPVYP